ncbi:MAG: hypothetical protein OXE92_04640 [Bacteroidetes bacterium]|nr:hypothetical protein [Bacteroidota bacterium]MCY4204997.1 hypothetical protein [Bacteroidota bacterium]
MIFGVAIYAIPFFSQAQNQSGVYLQDIDHLLESAYSASQQGEQSTDIQAIKSQADFVIESIWGISSGLLTKNGAASVHGWKTRWQTDGTEFDQAHYERHGSDAPRIFDPAQLGVMGRGRAIIRMLSDSSNEAHADHVIISLSNVIGWMRLSDGVTKGERQPRIDLTHVWDAPTRFWNSTADTGWLGEVYAQALNILKTDYRGNLSLAREHISDLTILLDKCRMGEDENEDGIISPIMMEGGINTAIQHAEYLGIF